jgi:hypothetical protein
MAQSLGTSLSISQTVYEPSWDETQVKQGMQKHAMGMRRGGRGRGNQERLLLGSYSTSNEAAFHVTEVCVSLHQSNATNVCTNPYAENR